MTSALFRLWNYFTVFVHPGFLTVFCLLSSYFQFLLFFLYHQFPVFSIKPPFCLNVPLSPFCRILVGHPNFIGLLHNVISSQSHLVDPSLYTNAWIYISCCCFFGSRLFPSFQSRLSHASSSTLLISSRIFCNWAVNLVSLAHSPHYLLINGFCPIFLSVLFCVFLVAFNSLVRFVIRLTAVFLYRTDLCHGWFLLSTCRIFILPIPSLPFPSLFICSWLLVSLVSSLYIYHCTFVALFGWPSISWVWILEFLSLAPRLLLLVNVWLSLETCGILPAAHSMFLPLVKARPSLWFIALSLSLSPFSLLFVDFRLSLQLYHWCKYCKAEILQLHVHLKLSVGLQDYTSRTSATCRGLWG